MQNNDINTTLFKEYTIVEAYRGSISHNLAVQKDGEMFKTDDIDTMIFFSYPKHYYFSLAGYTRKKEVYEKKTGKIDLVAYEVRKAFYLLAGLNPNVTPILYSKKKHYIKITPEFEYILENRAVFNNKNLLRRVYGGYARSQYKKMLNKNKYFGFQGARRKELYKKLGYDAKHAQHAIRLLRVGREWLLDGEPQIYRTTDREELLSIKMGNWTLEQIQILFEKELKLLDQAYIKSKLPEKNTYSNVSKLLYKVMTWWGKT